MHNSIVYWVCGSTPILKEVEVTNNNGNITFEKLSGDGYPDSEGSLMHKKYWDTDDTRVGNRMHAPIETGDKISEETSMSFVAKANRAITAKFAVSDAYKLAAKADIGAFASGKSDAVKAIADTAKQSIDSAADVAGVNTAKQAGITAINAQIKKEQDEAAAVKTLADAKAAAKKEVSAKVKDGCSQKVKDIRDKAFENIEKAKSVDEVNQIKDKAINDIVKARQADCPHCSLEHSGFFGWLIKFFHSILAMFENKYTG